MTTNSKTPLAGTNNVTAEDLQQAKQWCSQYNDIDPTWHKVRLKHLQQRMHLTGKAQIESTFSCLLGTNIILGDAFYANHNVTIHDYAPVRFGNACLVGPNTLLTTQTLNDQFANITIGNHVWIGGNVIIYGGVEIGDNTIIGAGSIVTESIPANMIAFGQPCLPIKQNNSLS